MPGKTEHQTCTSCVPPKTLSTTQDFNRHVLAFHRDEPLQIFCAMVENGVLCSESGCTNPIYKASGQKQHYNKRHPNTVIPEIPGRIITATELQRREREARTTNNNAINVQPINNAVMMNNNTPIVVANNSALTNATATAMNRSSTSNSNNIPSVVPSTNSISPIADTNQVNNNTTNSTTSLVATIRNSDTPDATTSAPSSVAPRRSARHATRINNSSNTNSSSSSHNVVASNNQVTVNTSPGTDNVPTADINPSNITTVPATTTGNAATPIPTTAITRRRVRRNPSQVHVQHTANNSNNTPTTPIGADVIAAADEINDLQQDIDLEVRRRNNIGRRRNNRHGVLHGDFDLLPNTTTELVINEDFEVELANLSDADFEERFFGFHHPRHDSIHYSHVGPIQLLVSKILQVMVDNNGLLEPNDAMKNCSRSALTAFNCLIMIIKCITVKRIDSGNRSNTVMEFVTHWNNLPVASMISSMLLYANHASQFCRSSQFKPRIYNSITTVIRASEKYMQQSKYSRALSLIDRALTPLVNDEEADENAADTINNQQWTHDELVTLTSSLHPPHDAHLDDVTNINAEHEPPMINITAEQLKDVVKGLDSTAAEGMDSWNYFHLKKIILHCSNIGNHNNEEAAINEGDNLVFNSILTALARLANYFIAGTINNVPLWSLSRLIFINKENSATSYRPIAVGSALYRLLAQCILPNVTAQVGNLLSPIQIGVGIKDGGAILATSMKALTCNHEDLCILSFDIANAFNRERRGRTAAGVAKYCPALLALYKNLYGIDGSSLRSSHGKLLGRSCTGVRQGDPLAMLLFCCSIQDTLIEINDLIRAKINANTATSTLLNLWMQGSYADDLNICLPVVFAEEIFTGTINIFETNGFRLNRAKSTIYLSGRYRDDQELIDLYFPNTGNTHLVYKKKILGVTFGSDADVSRSLDEHVSELKRLLVLLKYVPANISFYLLKYCINAMPSYMHRILQPGVTSAAYSIEVDNLVIGAIEHMLQCPLPKDNQVMLRFPCKLGGTGIAAWHSFIPRVQYDLLQQRTIDFLESHMDSYRCLLPSVRRSRQQFTDNELGFASGAPRDYQQSKSNKRSISLFEQLQADYLVFLRNKGRCDIITHIEHQLYPTSGMLFGINYIRSCFIQDPSLFVEALGYRLKVPLIAPPPPDPAIPPPRPYYRCLHCERYRHGYNINSVLFEHSFRCPVVSSDVTHRHDSTVQAIKKYITETRGDSVQVTKGTRENTHGDRGQICDLVIAKRGQPDVLLDITYSAGVDAYQNTNQIFPAPIASIVLAENNKRGHYQRNDGSPGNVIPLAFSFSGHFMGPSFIAFCNTIEASDNNAQLVYDYNAHYGVKFIRTFHPARRRLISELTRHSYLFISKARIRARQQLFHQEEGNNGPHLHPVFAAHPHPHYASFNSLNQPLMVERANRILVA